MYILYVTYVHIGGYLPVVKSVKMDHRLSATLLDVLGRVPGAESLPQRFPLLFPNAPQMSSRSQSLSSLSDSDRRVSASQVSPCTQRVGTQVNVVNGDISSLNVGGSEDTVTVTNQQSTESTLSPIDIPIKVINPSKKRESKTYMLNIPIDHIHNLKSLCEHILEQLGKNVVSFDLQFDVGYFSSTHKICFIDGDDIKTELKRLSKAGRHFGVMESQQDQAWHLLSVLTLTQMMSHPLRSRRKSQVHWSLKL